jgi:hypothetical protein
MKPGGESNAQYYKRTGFWRENQDHRLEADAALVGENEDHRLAGDAALVGRKKIIGWKPMPRLGKRGLVELFRQADCGGVLELEGAGDVGSG